MMPLGQGAVPRTRSTLSRCHVVPYTDTSTLCALQTQPVLSTLPMVGRYARGREQLRQTRSVPPPPLVPRGHFFSASPSLLL